MNCETCLYPNNTDIKIEGNCPFASRSEINKSKSNNLGVWISILTVVFILIIIGIIVYIKCYQNKGIIKKNKDISDYYNIDKKNIAFDDENSPGIN